MFANELTARLAARAVELVDIRDDLPRAWAWNRRALNRVTAVIVHYDAGFRPDQYNPLDRYIAQANGHIGRGWATLAYHIKVSGDGRAWLNNDFEDISYHAGDANPYSIGVCLDCGAVQEPTKGQVKTLYELLVVLTKESPEIRATQQQVLGNREVWPTACPGDYIQAYVVEFRETGQIRDAGGGAMPQINTEQVYFPETKHYLSFGFLAWWRANSGLTCLGYPIREEEDGPEGSDVKSQQWFERGRLEHHPGNLSPFRIQLGLVGRECLALQARVKELEAELGAA